MITDLSGWFRHHRAEHNNVWGEALFSFAFPHFDPPNWTPDSKLAKINAMPDLDAHIFQSRQHRRYGGWDLDRGRYYSVSSDEFGNDGGTLASELNAYRDHRDGELFVEVNDIANFPTGFADSAGLSFLSDNEKLSCLVVSIFPSIRLRDALLRLPGGAISRVGDPRALDALDDDTLVHLILRPKTVHRSLTNVVDLRLPSTREEFFDAFRTGDSGWGIEDLYKRELGDNITEFYEMLPELLDQAYGGTTEVGGTTQMIGDTLRQCGVNGLVFPSARNDIEVVYIMGVQESFYGWNFVDFSDSPVALADGGYVKFGPWNQTLGDGIELAMKNDGDLAGWLRVSGQRSLNKRRYLATRSASLLDRLDKRCKRVAVIRGSTNLDR